MPVSKKRKGAKPYRPRISNGSDALRFDGAAYADSVHGTISDLSLAFELKLEGGECTYREVELVRHFMMVALVTLMSRPELFCAEDCDAPVDKLAGYVDAETIARVKSDLQRKTDEAVALVGKHIQDGLRALAGMVAKAEKREGARHYWAFPNDARDILDGLRDTDQVVRIAVDAAPRLFAMEALAAEYLCLGRVYNSHFQVTQDEVKKLVRRFVHDTITRQEWLALRKFHDAFHEECSK